MTLPNLKVITIAIPDDTSEPPTVDLSGCTPMEAFGAISGALQTVSLLIPHCNLNSNGQPILIVDDD